MHLLLYRETLRKLVDSSFQVSMMERDNYVGRILTGRIYSGILQVGDKVHGLHSTDSGIVKIEEGKVGRIEFCAWHYFSISCDVWFFMKSLLGII